MEISIDLLSILFAVAIVAGLIDTLAGGGGLITIPALMVCGLPPVMALGTNKFQACLGTGTATFLLLKRRRLRWRHIRQLLPMAFIGAVLGSTTVLFINQRYLTLIVPAVLSFILVYFLLYRPGARWLPKIKMPARRYARWVVGGIGFYDGMFGPGTGSFFALAGVMFRKAQLVFATATAKPLNFATNIGSLAVFALSGSILLKVGAAMMCGQMIGAYLGTHFLYRINPKYLRWLVITMSASMLVKYLHAQGSLALS